ncbi:MAG: hypothetical protein QY331_07700 [Melioribacteraceae bacterium]|nr:MAG: hypothetical protein QY331_07700 [Melioribacteraceae bacterium]
MSHANDTEWIPITMETTLRENDVVSNIELKDGKEELIIWRLLTIEDSPFPGLIPLRSIMRSGVAIDPKDRREMGVVKEYFVENNFSLLVGKSDNENDWPVSLIEAVELLKSKLTVEQQDEIRNYKQDDLIDLHFSLGLWIRNTFGLHGGNKQLLMDCSPDKPEPDNVSGIIIEEFWKSLQNV